MDENLSVVRKDVFPKPVPRPSSKTGMARARKAEITLEGIEMAAIAFVRMEQGIYKYADGSRKRFDEDGKPTINKSELMRLAGYNKGSWENFDQYLGQKEKFWQLVELHRIRATDPKFRADYENQLWADVGGEAMRNLYERLTYSPHSMPTNDLIKIVQLMLSAGLTMQKLGANRPEESKADKLMQTLTPEQREKVMKERKESLLKELRDIESLDRAYKAEEVIDVSADD